MSKCGFSRRRSIKVYGLRRMIIINPGALGI
jgi:hypothetical protein